MTSVVFVSEDLNKSVTQISFDEVGHPYQVIVYSIIESNPSTRGYGMVRAWLGQGWVTIEAS